MTERERANDGRAFAIETVDAGRRFGGFWALRNCSLQLPTGSITALVGANGAGKTTLLNMLVGLLPPSEGQLTVVGRRPGNDREFLAKVGFVAQDCPLYREFSVADLLRLGRHLNPRWDDQVARERLAAADVPLNRRAGRLSGGQRAQVALALAVAKRPELLLLDEPLASLDPLARRQFLQSLMAIAADTGMTIMMSSHLIGELARVCDHLAVIAGGRLRLSGDVEDILEQHRWVTGSPEDTERLPAGVDVVTESRHERHSRLLVRSRQPLLNPALTSAPIDLEDLVLAYLEGPRSAAEQLAHHAGSRP